MTKPGLTHDQIFPNRVTQVKAHLKLKVKDYISLFCIRSRLLDLMVLLKHLLLCLFILLYFVSYRRNKIIFTEVNKRILIKWTTLFFKTAPNFYVMLIVGLTAEIILAKIMFLVPVFL